MKKFIFSALAAIGLLLSPSCSDENEALSGSDNEALVSFNVNLADGISTKAKISDGKRVNRLCVRVFEDNNGGLGNLVEALSNDGFTVSNGTGRATMQLVKGKTYHLLFWADKHDVNENVLSPYTIDENGKTITVAYTGATCNDENRDAFFATYKLTVPNENTFTQSDIFLNRPFAQLNFLVDKDEIDAAKKMGLDFGSAQTSIKITNAATTFSPFESTDKISGTANPAPSFNFADVPFGDNIDDLPSADNTTITGDAATVYYYLATTYVLANGNADEVTLIVNDRNENYTTKYRNIPFQQNYRTNIFGKLLTEEGTFTVSVDKSFGGGDINKDPSDLQTQP